MKTCHLCVPEVGSPYPSDPVTGQRRVLCPPCYEARCRAALVLARESFRRNLTVGRDDIRDRPRKRYTTGKSALYALEGRDVIDHRTRRW